MGPGTQGVWLPVALNECFKFARYTPGTVIVRLPR